MVWWMFLILGWLLFIRWVSHFPSFLFFLRKRRLFLFADLPVSTFPMVSIIVSARNEEDKIERCLASLMELDYPTLEIIAVNDRSTDGTGIIMDGLSVNDDRLTAIHIEGLPEKWLGKNHAMHIGSQKAKGDFLLFTDGDIIFKNNTLRLAMGHTLDKGLDHLVLFPRAITNTFWETAFTGFFGFIYIMVIKPAKVLSGSMKSYAGAGAFNLIKRSSYMKIGGHVPLRLEVIDDLKLGKLVKMSGLRQDILLADDLLSVRWHDGVWGLVKGFEKNMFASLNFSIAKLLYVTLLMIYGFFFPYIGIIMFHGLQIWGYVFAILAMHTLFGFYGTQTGGGFKTTFSLPFAAMLFLWSYWNSTFKTLYNGGISWRDTFYPIKLLKDNKYN